MPLRWAIIGCGDIARKRVGPAMVEDEGSEPVAMFSNSLDRAREMCDLFGARRATDRLDDIWADDEVDAVYIASPHFRHRDETVAAARAGKHVLCEKPMACDVAECREMIAACADRRVALGIAYYRRWYPKARKMKELIAAGVIGTPIRARVCIGGLYSPTPEDWKRWRVSAQARGGALMDVGSHRLDLICYLLGEPQRVCGLTDHRVMDYAVPDTESLLCRMADGTHVTCSCYWNMPLSADEMEIHGTEGSLLATPFDGNTLVVRTRAGEETLDVSRPFDNVHLPLVASFAARVGTGQPPEFDGTDGMQATRIIDGCYRSHASGQWEAV
ncbi:Gfo/Idh/MocA family oxidoreductase [bacterium]|nr:Gfo/Idh/MocA family oxidoreductase [bacterium]